MSADHPFIFYSLPKSRTTQQLNNSRKIEKVWDNVSNFLNSCTTVKPAQPDSLSLRVYLAYPGDANPELAKKILTETKSFFGEGETTPLSYDYPKGTPSKETKTDFKLTAVDLMKAVNYLIDGQPWPKFSFGPIELIISYQFKFVDLNNKIELKNQDSASSLLIWLSRNCICSPSFCFPFKQPDTEFYDYLKQCEAFLPFNLEHKYLKTARPNDRKKGYYIYNKI